MRLSLVSKPAGALVLFLSAAALVRAGQQVEGSLTELDVVNRELKVTLDAALDENRQLREALSRAEASLIEMRKAIAANSGEAEVFRRQALELKKRFEALGTSATGDSKKLEQRLLAAVNDLQQAEAEKKKLTLAMIRLNEAVLRYAKSAPNGDAEARLILEGEMRNANQAIGADSASATEGTPVSPTLTDAIVISVSDELSLVVANLGRSQGVRVGMPFKVLRNENVIGSVRVVDVREKFSGAVIQHLNSETTQISVGDRLKVDTQQ